MKTPKSLLEATRYFADEQVCIDYIASLRWADGPVCPKCEGKEHSWLTTRKLWKCKSCKKQFSVRVGTIFEESRIALDKWLIAIWLIVNAKNGISSYELGRSLDITQKSAWFMGQRIRLALHTGSFDKKLGGEVEADETYIGGKARNMHKDRRAKKIKGTGGRDKALVMGILERKGEVRTSVIENNRRSSIMPVVTEHVEPGSKLFTDELRSYHGAHLNYDHRVINHAVCYAKGKIHTNGLENFWSLLKRGLGGTYVSVEPFHLFRYLDEQVFRFNTRKDSDADRFSKTIGKVSAKRLTYKTLTGGSAA